MKRTRKGIYYLIIVMLRIYLGSNIGWRKAVRSLGWIRGHIETAREAAFRVDEQSLPDADTVRRRIYRILAKRIRDLAWAKYRDEEDPFDRQELAVAERRVNQVVPADSLSGPDGSGLPIHE